MAVNKDSNAYTFIFSVVMVVVVGALLSFIAESLEDRIADNTKNKTKIDILGAVGVEADRKNVEELFEKYIVEKMAVNHKGEVIENPIDKKEKPIKDILEIDVKKDFRDKTLTTEKTNFPLYVAEKEGNRYFIIPMVGKGLWGPIWGFMAIDAKDGNTVYGATFDHKTETPGLGAEIKEDFFEVQFSLEDDKYGTKQIFGETGGFKSVAVIKGGTDRTNPHGVDAITGGTITSNGVNEMIKRTLKIYAPYLKANKG